MSVYYSGFICLTENINRKQLFSMNSTSSAALCSGFAEVSLKKQKNVLEIMDKPEFLLTYAEVSVEK